MTETSQDWHLEERGERISVPEWVQENGFQHLSDSLLALVRALPGLDKYEPDVAKQAHHLIMISVRDNVNPLIQEVLTPDIERIKPLRDRADLSVTALGKQVRIKPYRIFNIERGEVIPTRQEVQTLMTYLESVQPPDEDAVPGQG